MEIRKKSIGMKKKNSPLKSIHENKISKKRGFNGGSIRDIIPEIVEFLKSDSYLYSHLCSSSASYNNDVFFASKDKPILGNMDSMKEKVVEYLKSDMYLYAPLEGTPRCDDSVMKTVVSPPRGQELQFMRVTSTVLSKKIAWETKNVAENYVAAENHRDHGSKNVPHDVSMISPQTPALQEVKKPVARRSSRLSTHSG